MRARASSCSRPMLRFFRINADVWRLAVRSAWRGAGRRPTTAPVMFEARTLLDGAAWNAPGASINDLFAATVEAVEEAVVDALFTATTTIGRDGHVLHALPIDRTLEILEKYGRPPKT
jgi:Peptidase family S58